MTKLKGLITLFISLVIVLGGCGKPTPGYKIYRINDTLLVFLAMKDSSEIVNATIDNNELHVDIDTGEQIENRVMSLQRKFMVQLIKSDETLEIKGTDRINRYEVVHLTITPPIHRGMSMFVNWTGLEKRGFSKEPGPFANSSAFRVGDRITAYCLLPDKVETSWEISNLGSSIQIKHSTTFENVENDANGNRVLNIETDDPDLPSQNLSFLLKELQPHETVKVEDKKKLGKDVFIVNLRVVPKKNEPIRIVPERNRPFKRQTLIDR